MTNYINPTKDSFQRFRETRRSGPIHMLNLIKLRQIANYEDGTKATGAEAYATYGRETTPSLRAVGGRVIWSGRPEVMVIGPESGENWDIAFIVEYPDIDAFTTMIRDPAYQAVTHHRTAAVETSRLVRMEPLEPGKGFGKAKPE